jgi:hypothetical protein
LAAQDRAIIDGIYTMALRHRLHQFVYAGTRKYNING